MQNNITNENKPENAKLVIINNQETNPINTVNQIPESSLLTKYPINIYNDLQNIKVGYVGIENDIFRIFHCQERNSLSFKIYYLDENNKINVLFNVNEHFVPEKCCSCCQCDIVNGCCCAYVCNNRIIYQLDFLKNNLPFATLGQNISKGCYCCKISCCTGCNCCGPCCSNCVSRNVLSQLHLRLNDNPKNEDFSYGQYLGKSTAVILSCCGPFSNTVEITDENQNVKWIVGLINKCCDCKCWCWDCCHCCDEVFSDKLFEIYDGNNNKCGDIIIPFGSCSRKLEKDCCCKACCGGCCSCYRVNPYYEIHFPENANSLDKFYIISAVIMFEKNFGVVHGKL